MALLKIKNENNQWIDIPALKGKDGHTPVKGVDYYTEAEKTEIVNLVLSALPSAEEVSV